MLRGFWVGFAGRVLLPGLDLVVECLVMGRAVVALGLVVLFILLVVVTKLVCVSIGVGAEITP